MRISNKMMMQFLALETWASYRSKKLDSEKIRSKKQNFLHWVLKKYGEQEQEECDFYFWMFLQNLDS